MNNETILRNEIATQGLEKHGERLRSILLQTLRFAEMGEKLEKGVLIVESFPIFWREVFERANASSNMGLIFLNPSTATQTNNSEYFVSQDDSGSSGFDIENGLSILSRSGKSYGYALLSNVFHRTMDHSLIIKRLCEMGIVEIVIDGSFILGDAAFINLMGHRESSKEVDIDKPYGLVATPSCGAMISIAEAFGFKCTWLSDGNWLETNMPSPDKSKIFSTRNTCLLRRFA